MKSFWNVILLVGGILFLLIEYGVFGGEGMLDSSYISPFVISLITALIVFVSIVGLIGLLLPILTNYLQKIVKKTATTFDDELLVLVCNTLASIKYLLALFVALQFVSFPEVLEEYISVICSVGFFIVFLIILTRLVNIFFNHGIENSNTLSSMRPALYSFLRKISIVAIWIVGIITVISQLGYDITAFIAGAGVGGIAIALAAQKSIANIFGAVTILVNKPFHIGDYVTINSHTGTVKELGLSYITLIDRLGHEVMIPNENIISSSIENETEREFRRADFSIGLIYDTTLAQMEKGVKIIEDILEEYVENKLLQSYRVNFEAFGDFSLNINVTYFSNTFVYNEFTKEKEHINLEIKKQFGKAKLEMAFPTTEMIIKKGDI